MLWFGICGIAFYQLRVQIATDGTPMVACVELAGGIAEKGAQAAAPILRGNGRDLILGRRTRCIRSYDYVAVGVAVLSTRGQAFVHQTGGGGLLSPPRRQAPGL